VWFLDAIYVEFFVMEWVKWMGYSKSFVLKMLLGSSCELW